MAEYQGGGDRMYGSRGRNDQPYDSNQNGNSGNNGYRRRKRSDDIPYQQDQYQNKRHRNNYNSYGRNQHQDQREYGGERNYRPNNYRDRDYRRDRDRDDDTVELRRRVITLGDNINVNDANAIQDTIQRCGDWLGEQLMFQAEEIAKLVVSCAGRLSTKSDWYAMLTTLLNEKNGVFGKKVVEVACQAVQADIDFLMQDDGIAKDSEDRDADPLRKSDNSRIDSLLLRIKLLVRFIGNLATTKMVLAEDVLGLLDTLQSVCTTQEMEMSDSERSIRKEQNANAIKDFFALVVLDTILHVSVSN